MANDGAVVIDVLLDSAKAMTEYNKLGSVMSGTGSKIGSALKAGTAAAIAGTVAVGVAAVGIGKQVLASYADYEQLVGGVDTLFGNASKTVQGFADNAYKTAGLSANAYMETVTGFSASMVASLKGDTAKAADYSNQAVVDMADNANKMGSNIGDIQNAYQGFAKQNYTMLDNLKLGYGGTQEEMKRLLSDAEKFSGQKYDISSFADVTQAIHVVQTQMGITGTTAKEAASTISGSIDSTKAALSNLMAGLGKSDVDLKGLTKNVIDSFKNVVRNIIPIVVNIAKAIPVVFLEVAREVGAALLGMLPDSIQKRIEAIVSSFKNFLAPVGEIVDGFKRLYSAFKSLLALDMSPMEAIKAIFKGMLSPLSSWPPAFENIAKAIKSFMDSNKGASNAVDGMIQGVRNLVNFFGNIFSPVQKAGQSIDIFKVALFAAKTILLTALGPIGLVIKIFELLAKVVGGGDVQKGLSSIGGGIQGLVVGIANYGPMIGTNFGKAISGIAGAIANALPGIISGGLQIISGFILGIAQGLPGITAAIIQLIGSITLTIVTLIPTITASAILIVTTLATSMITYIPVVIGAITSIIVAILGSLAQALPQIILAGTNLIVSFIAGITAALPSLIASTANLIVTWLNELNKHLPDILQAGFNVLITFLKGIADNIGQITDMAITIIVNFANAIASRMPDIVQAAANLIVNFVNGIANNIGSIIDSAVNLIVKFLEGIARKIPDIVNAAMDLVDAIVRGIGQASGRLMDAGIRLIRDLASNIRSRQDDIRSAAGELLRAIVGVFVPDSLIEAGSAIINGFLGGLKSGFENVKSFVGGIADWIKEHKGPISYDRKLLIPAGGSIMEGLDEGLQDKFKKVQANVSSMANKLADSLTGGLPSLDTALNASVSSSTSYSQAQLVNSNNATLSEKIDKMGDRIDEMNQRKISIKVNGREVAETIYDDFETVKTSRDTRDRMIGRKK